MTQRFESRYQQRVHLERFVEAFSRHFRFVQYDVDLRKLVERHPRHITELLLDVVHHERVDAVLFGYDSAREGRLSFVVPEKKTFSGQS